MKAYNFWHLLVLWPLVVWSAPTVAEEFSVLGMKVGPIPEEDSAYQNVHGAYVIKVESGSAAERAGLRTGHVITAILLPKVGRFAVTNAEELVAFVEEASERGHQTMILRLVKPPFRAPITCAIKLR